MADAAARAIAERFRVMQPSATVEYTERIRAARASGRRILGCRAATPTSSPTHALSRRRNAPCVPTRRITRLPPANRNSARQLRGARRNGPARATTRTISWSRPAESLRSSPRSWASLTRRRSPGAAAGLGQLRAMRAPVRWRARGGADARPARSGGDGCGSYRAHARAHPEFTGQPDRACAERGRTCRSHRAHAKARSLDRFRPSLFRLDLCGKFPYPQALAGGFERTLVVDSLSKSFGITGWRLGYLALPPGMAKSLVNSCSIQSIASRPLSRLPAPRHCRCTTNWCRNIATCSIAGLNAPPLGSMLCRGSTASCQMQLFICSRRLRATIRLLHSVGLRKATSR